MTQYSGVYTLQQQGQALTSGQWATDPYYLNTTLLLHADGVAGGAQNNTFLDSSSNANALTAGGNLSQGSFTPYGPDWSNYFPSGSMLSTAYSPGFDFGTGDFTMEAWVNLDALPAPQTIFSCVDSGATVGYSLLILANGFVEVDVVAAQSFICNSNPVPIGKWTHVAFTKSSGTYRAFVNGSLCTTSSNTLGTTINSTSQGMCVGRSVASGYNFPLAGYISNARIVKGTAMYTSSFTPSTTPLPVVSGTSLLTCQSNGFTDAGLSYLPLTVTSTPSVQRFSPFPPQYQYTTAVIGGSAYNPGAAYISTSYGGSVGSTDDFTAEGWFYLTANADNGNLVLCSGSLGVIMTQNGQKLSSYFPSVGFVAWQASALVQNTWHYIVVQRSSSTLSCYLNGTRLGTQAGATGGWTYNGAGLYLTGQTSTREVGYYTDVRISTIARYAGTTMTVPTAPLTSDANTTFLLSTNNAGIYDNAMISNMQTVGNAQVSTSNYKYGSGSLYFNSSNSDYLSVANGTVLNTGDFTVEFWMYTTSLAASFAPFSFGASDTTANCESYVKTTGEIVWYNYGEKIASGAGAIVANTWQHIAFSRANGVTKMFINGVQFGSSYADTTNYTGAFTYVGRGYGVGGLLGYLDDFRVTKGVGRYTANFIPPKVAFANQ